MYLITLSGIQLQSTCVHAQIMPFTWKDAVNTMKSCSSTVSQSIATIHRMKASPKFLSLSVEVLCSSAGTTASACPLPGGIVDAENGSRYGEIATDVRRYGV